jgi:hypothetical protein
LGTDRAERPAHRVAVIGDIAGHLDELRTELRRLGADGATGWLPGDLTIIQVGDLVHRGPASDAVVALVDGYLTRQPMQWVQLVGNHEAHYLRCAIRCSTGVQATGASHAARGVRGRSALDPLRRCPGSAGRGSDSPRAPR